MADEPIGGAGPELEPQALEQQAEGIGSPAVAPTLQQTNKLLKWADHRQTPNIAMELTEDELGRIGQRVTEEYRIDETSRSGWVERTKDAMDLAMQIAEEKTYPWPKASNVIYPLMTVAAIEFGARAYPAIVQGRDVVKGIVIGPDDGVPALASDGQPAVEVMRDPQTGALVPAVGPDGNPTVKWKVPPGEKKRRADRIAQHMSWQCLEEMEEWEDETDKLLHILPIAGCMFRKTFFDPRFGCNASVLANSMNVVVNYWAKALERAQRITEKVKFYPIEIRENELAEIWLDHDYGQAQSADGDPDAPHEFLEQHRYWDLDGDDYPEPYIVTVHKDTGKIARICARYDAEGVFGVGSAGSFKVRKIDPVHYYTKFDFLPNIEGGIYGMGFGQLLTPINNSVNSTLNMLIDAGHRQVVGGGFIGKGLSMHSGQVRFKMGEYRPVNVPGSTIRDAIVTVDAPQPSAVLFQLLGTLIDAGNKIGSIKDVLSGDASLATMQPTTLLALIEQGTKVYTGIIKRVLRCEKKEFDKLYRLNRVYGEEQMKYRVGDEWSNISREDYELGSGVKPVSDPSMVNDMQRLAKAAFLQGYQNDPYCDPIEIRTRIFDASQIPDPDKLFAKQQGPTPDAIMAAAKIEHESIKVRADAINKLSGAVLNLANADKAVGDMAMALVNQQFEILKAQLGRLDEPARQIAGGGGNAAGPGDIRNQEERLPELAPSPGDEAGPGPLPGGFPVGA